MNINIEEMKSMGFGVEISKDKSTISIFPIRADSLATDLARELCATLGFNDRETDDMFSAMARIQIMSAIRKCSGW